MSKEIEYHNGGLGFVPTLGIIFIILKLCKVITWSWIWVVSPFWISLLLILIIAIIVGIASIK